MKENIDKKNTNKLWCFLSQFFFFQKIKVCYDNF